MLNRFHLFLLLVWLLMTAVSYPLFLYLTNNPGVMLGIEKTQPGVSMRIGRENLQAGNLELAVEAFSHAQKQYATLFKESGLKRHQEYLANAKIGIADSYRILGATPERKIAVEYYQDVLAIYPKGKHGQWHLSIGMALEQLQQYDKAIHHFDQTMQYGTGLTRLYTYYERGRSYLEQGILEPACEDLYWFVRSQRWELAEEQWLEFLRLENAEHEKRYFILAFAYKYLGKNEEALAAIQRYLAFYPNDRAALYLRSSLLGQPFVQDGQVISLSELLPPQSSTPYRLTTSGLFNLYIAEAGFYSLQLRLSPDGEVVDNEPDTMELPKVSVTCNGEDVSSFYAAGDEPTDYSIALELVEGKNLVQFQTQPPAIDEPQQVVNLYSIKLLPASD